MSEVLARWPRPRDMLPPSEVGYVEKFSSPQDRAERLTARVLVRECLRDVGARTSGIEIRHQSSGARRGAPLLVGSDIHVSISHSAGWVAAAISPGVVGIDVESLRNLSRFRLSGSSLLTEDELREIGESVTRFGVSWTAREVLVKCGVGTLDDVRADLSRLLTSSTATANVQGVWLTSHCSQDLVWSIGVADGKPQL